MESRLGVKVNNHGNSANIARKQTVKHQVNNYWNDTKVQRDQTGLSVFSVPSNLLDGEYVGNQKLLHNVVESLQHNRKVALHGLGGIGTSRLAAEAASMLHGKAFDCIIWIDASSESSFIENMEIIADNLGLDFKPNAASRTNAVKMWMENEKNGSWLLVLDAAAPEAVMEGVQLGAKSATNSFVLRLPRQSSASLRTILITTCQKNIAIKWCPDEQVFEVPFLEPEEAMGLLQKKSGDKESPLQDVATLAKELDYNPSAILVAATLIRIGREEEVTISSFLQNCRKHNDKPVALLDEEEPALAIYPMNKSLIATWHKAIEFVHTESPKALELLFLIACLGRSNISFRLFHHAFGWQESILQHQILILLNHRLITKGRPDRLYSMPRLVQLTVKHWIKTHPQAFHTHRPLLDWHLRALDCLLKEYDSMEPQDGISAVEAQLKRRSLLPHADEFQRFCRLEKKRHIVALQEKQFRAIVIFAELFSSEGRYEEAERMLAYAMVSPVKASHWRKIALLRLAEGLRNQCSRNRFLVNEDKKRLKKAMLIVKKVKEIEGQHESIDFCSTIALLLAEKGDFKMAAVYQAKIVESLTQDFGRDDPGTVDARLQLSKILGRGGHPDKALREQKDIAQLLRSASFSPDPNTALRLLQVQAALVGTYHIIGSPDCLQSAADMAQEVVTGRTSLFGDQDMKTISSEQNLASCLIDLNRITEAIGILERVERKLRQKFGPDHVEARDSLAWLNDVRGEIATSYKV